MQEAPQAGTQPAQPTPPAQPSGTRPHRGGAVLALGIIGIVVCFICGIIAWVMASKDLKEMDAGRMDPSGKGLTKAGMICGIVGVVLTALGIIWWLIAIFALGSAGFFDGRPYDDRAGPHVH